MLVILTVMPSGIFCHAAGPEIDAQSAILIEQSTGKVLYEKNADQPLPPASVTKVMTMLLVMEAIDNGICSFEDQVTVSEYASSMGGSQVFLSPGEVMTVEDLLKSVTVASANDAAVALAEFLAGSEEAFVERMNIRAAELGMVNTHFENANGLDDSTENHVTSARDIAIMSSELLRHPKILEFTTIWMDSIRGGEFTLTNTNRLIRFYNGANGLKTGSTSKAKFCISASAKRDGMQLIAVIMGSPTRDIRNEAAKKLLDYGFANYTYVHFDGGNTEPIPVTGGIAEMCNLGYDGFEIVGEKSKLGNVTKRVNLPENLSAPVHAGDVVGNIEYVSSDEVIGTVDIKVLEDVERIGYFGIFVKLLHEYLMI